MVCATLNTTDITTKFGHIIFVQSGKHEEI